MALEDEVYEAEKHLLLGTKESAEVLARTLYGWYKQDQVHTAPTYIARAYFGYLLVGNLREASRSLDVFVQRLVQDNPSLVIQEVQSASADIRVFPSLPLLNFLKLLGLGIRTVDADVFRNLKSHYSSQLKEVPAWDDVRFFLSQSDHSPNCGRILTRVCRLSIILGKFTFVSRSGGQLIYWT